MAIEMFDYLYSQLQQHYAAINVTIYCKTGGVLRLPGPDFKQTISLHNYETFRLLHYTSPNLPNLIKN